MITVTNASSFDPYSLKWPKHYTGEIMSGKNIECNDDDEVIEFDAEIPMGGVFTCSATDPGDAPAWCNTSCGLVGVSAEIDTVTAGDACLKLIKRWTVIDWCYWDANGASPEDDANDTDNDSFEAVEDWAQGVCSGCDENVSYDPVYFRYTDVDVDGYYTYDQIIKVVDDKAPEIATADVVVNTTDRATSKDDDTACTGTGIITASASDLCGSEEISGELLSWIITYDNGTESSVSTADGAEFTMETQAGSHGDIHIVDFVVTDGCGNKSSATSTVTFGDDKKPVPLCIAGVTTAFMEVSGTVEVWAKDFDLGSFDNCTEVEFSITHAGGNPDSAMANITFDCSDLESVYELDVYVTDQAENRDYCTVSVIVGGSCDFEGGSGTLISGSLYTEAGVMIEDATVNIYSPSLSEYPKSIITDASGTYVFDQNPISSDYDVQASKDEDYLNGVTSADLYAIQLHALGIRKLDSPYQMLAADINNDQVITAIDLVLLRKAILGLTVGFPNNTSWRFVDASQTFEKDNEPWPFTELLEFDGLIIDHHDQDFIGVKIGDVNQSAVANSKSLAKIRSGNKISLSIQNSQVEKGKQVSVDVFAEALAELTGIQFTMDHVGLKLNSIESGLIDIDEEAIGTFDEKFTMSWINIYPVALGDVLFTLNFEALDDIELSKVIKLNSSVTPAEAYITESADAAEIEFVVESHDQSITQLYQNHPNPFNESTSIHFALIDTKDVEFSVFNSNGALIYRVIDNFSKGMNEIIIDKSILQEPGLYYYSLETADRSQIKKMVYIH